MSSSSDFPPLAATDWLVYRIIPSRFPPVGLFDLVADPADLDDVIAIELMTNERLKDEIGEISRVAPEDRVSGPGSTPIMAAFTHINPDGARFTDTTFSGYYAAREVATAVAETVHHREIFLRQSAETRGRPIELDFRCYQARVQGELHDLRPWVTTRPELLDPVSYAHSQPFARGLRDAGAVGLIYPSMRATAGTCIVAFKPRILSDCAQERHLTYRWDGEAISSVYEKRPFDGRIS